MKKIGKIDPNAFTINDVFKIIDKYNKRIEEKDNISKDDLLEYQYKSYVKEDDVTAQMFDDPRKLVILMNGFKKLNGPIYVDYVLTK